MQKVISFLQQLLKTRARKFKISVERANLHLHLLQAFVEIRLSNVFFWKRKTGFGMVMKISAGCRNLMKIERECRIRTPLPDPLNTGSTLTGCLQDERCPDVPVPVPVHSNGNEMYRNRTLFTYVMQGTSIKSNLTIIQWATKVLRHLVVKFDF